MTNGETTTPESTEPDPLEVETTEPDPLEVETTEPDPLEVETTEPTKIEAAKAEIVEADELATRLEDEAGDDVDLLAGARSARDRHGRLVNRLGDR